MEYFKTHFPLRNQCNLFHTVNAFRDPEGDDYLASFTEILVTLPNFEKKRAKNPINSKFLWYLGGSNLQKCYVGVALNENHSLQLENLYIATAETLKKNINDIDLFHHAVEVGDEVLLDNSVSIRSLGPENERNQSKRLTLIARLKKDRAEE